MGLIGKIWVRLGLDNSEYKRGLDESKQQTNAFTNQLKSIGSKIAAAFAVEKIFQFGKEMISLRSKVLGVRDAFNALNQPTLLQDLRRATNNTVDDLTLMQRAVQANNFKIPLSQLSTYLQFATQRARETGQSVEYLVDSIITGLGRQSVMILDNLGISASEIRKRMEQGGSMAEAVGKIIQEEMSKSNRVMTESISIIDQMATSWSNFSSRLSTGGVGGFFRGLGLMLMNQMDAISSMGQGDVRDAEYQKRIAMDAAKIVMNSITSVTQAQEALKKLEKDRNTLGEIYLKQLLQEYIQQDELKKQNKEKMEQSIGGLQELMELKKQELLAATDQKVIDQLKKEIEAYDRKIKQKLGEVDILKNGLIPQTERYIEKRKELLQIETDPNKIAAINDEIAKAEYKLRVLKMTTSELKEHNRLMALGRDKLPTIGGVRGSVISNAANANEGMAEAERKAQKEWISSINTKPIDDAIKNQIEANKQVRQEALDQMKKDTEAAGQIAGMFDSLISNTVANSIEYLTDALSGVGDMDTKSIVAALLMPFADMAIAAGTIIATTGSAIESLKAALVSTLGTGAIAAGAALIAVGVGAKAGLKALAGGGKKAATQAASSTSFVGGAGGFNTAQSMQSPQLNLVGVLKGSDIYLSVQKETEKRVR